MDRIRACIEKKVPQPDKNYSSQTVGASLEIDVPEGESGDSVRQRFRQLYAILASEVESQIARMNGTPMPAAQTNRLPARNGNGNSHANSNNGHRQSNTTPNAARTGAPATASQKKAVFAICKSLGLDPAQYNADSMTVKEASALIDELKGQQAGSR